MWQQHAGFREGLPWPWYHEPIRTGIAQQPCFLGCSQNVAVYIADMFSSIAGSNELLADRVPLAPTPVIPGGRGEPLDFSCWPNPFREQAKHVQHEFGQHSDTPSLTRRGSLPRNFCHVFEPLGTTCNHSKEQTYTRCAIPNPLFVWRESICVNIYK